MKLISCQCCGVVLDTDNIDPNDEEQDIQDIEDIIIECPVCECKIFYKNGTVYT